MGLDMYLKAKRWSYKSAYENEKNYPAPDRDGLENALVEIPIPPQFDQFGSRTFVCTAMYWRKANAIHQWFVNRVQDGKDDCGSYYVSTDELSSLLGDIRTVLSDMSKAHSVLPSQEGFFFGSTDYDEWYFRDLEDTEKKLVSILSMPDLHKWTFYYESSW